MIKQFGLPKYMIWLFAGVAFVAIGSLAIFELTFGLLAFILTAVVAYLGYWFFFRPAFIELDIIKKGEPALAVILKMWETGIIINHNPRIGLLLEVRPVNNIPYEIEVKHNIKKERINNFKPGRTLSVKIDTRDPKRVAILPAA